MRYNMQKKLRNGLQVGLGVCIITLTTIVCSRPSLGHCPTTFAIGLGGYIFAGFVGGARARHPIQQSIFVGIAAFLVGTLWTVWETWGQSPVSNEYYEGPPALVALAGNCVVTGLGGLIAAAAWPFRTGSAGEAQERTSHGTPAPAGVSQGRISMKRIPMLFIFCQVLLVGPAAFGQAKGFQVGIELPTQLPVTPAVKAAIQDMGIGYINFYVRAIPSDTDEMAEKVRVELTQLCESLGVDYSIAVHHVDPPDSVVQQAAKLGGTEKARFRGLLFDELEHCRLILNYSPTPLADASKFETLTQAYEQTLAAYQRLHDRYAKMGSPVVATHVWPLLHHTAARAGFTVCPKICKEFYSPVSLATGLGAALQYGRDLWVDCDLWFYDLVPGHDAEESRSNLLLAYWMGADLLYVEGVGHNLEPAGKQGTPFTLMNQIRPDAYQPTAHGEVLRWFCREYLPKHPRAWTFRDLRPDIAIIRFEDTCHGQRYAADWPDHLYGSPNLHSSPDTEAWLGLWNVLTFGKTGSDGLSFFKTRVRASGYQRGVRQGFVQSYLTRPVQADQHRFFVPLKGVVVYDHLVGYERLKGIPLLFITGTQISDETFAAVKRCVSEGATCVAWGPLAKQRGWPAWKSGTQVETVGQGRFVITDDFGHGDAHKQIEGMIGRPDEISYRFGKQRVTLRRVTDNEIAVEVGGER